MICTSVYVASNQREREREQQQLREKWIGTIWLLSFPGMVGVTVCANAKLGRVSAMVLFKQFFSEAILWSSGNSTPCCTTISNCQFKQRLKNTINVHCLCSVSKLACQSAGQLFFQLRCLDQMGSIVGIIRLHWCQGPMSSFSCNII